MELRFRNTYHGILAMSISGILVTCKGESAQCDHIELAQRFVTVLIARNQCLVMLELFLRAADNGHHAGLFSFRCG